MWNGTQPRVPLDPRQRGLTYAAVVSRVKVQLYQDGGVSQTGDEQHASISLASEFLVRTLTCERRCKLLLLRQMA